MSTEALAVESVLVAELGRTRTRVCLVDLIDGTYRFVASGEAAATGDLPCADVTVGLQASVQHVAETTGRVLLRRDGLVIPQLANGDGVDSFFVVANVADPLRVAVLDAGAANATVAAVAHATLRLDVLVYTVLPPGRGAKPQEWVTQQAAVLTTWKPDVILLLTGSAGATDGLARIVDLIKSQTGPAVTNLAQLDEARSQQKVWAIVPEGLTNHLADQLATRTNLRFLPMESPDEVSALLATELSMMAHEQAADRVPGYDALVAWSHAPVVSREDALAQAGQFLARHGNRRIALVDVEETTSLHVAWSNNAAGAVIADANLGMCLPNLLGMTGTAKVQRWVPFELTEHEVTHWALNRAVRPDTVTTSLRDQLIEQAFAREAIQVARERLEPGVIEAVDLVIGSLRLGQWLTPAAAAMVLLDGAQPTSASGEVLLALDLAGVMSAMGALGQSEPQVAAEVLEHDAMTLLGSCLVLEGGGEGQRVASGRIQRDTGEPQEFEVRGGGLTLISLRDDEKASIELTLGNKARLGTSKAGSTLRLEAPAQVRGGTVGLIIDARGRPLNLSDDPRRQRERVREWLTTLGIVASGGSDDGAR